VCSLVTILTELFYPLSTDHFYGEPFIMNCSKGLAGPVPVPTRFEAWVCGRLLVGIAGSNPTVSMDVIRVVCCHVEVSASG